LHFNIAVSDKKLGNKNSTKIYKILRSFFEAGGEDFTNHKYLDFICNKHKVTLPESSKIERNSHYYVRDHLFRIKMKSGESKNIKTI